MVGLGWLLVRSPFDETLFVMKEVGVDVSRCPALTVQPVLFRARTSNRRERCKVMNDEMDKTQSLIEPNCFVEFVVFNPVNTCCLY